MWAEEVPPQRIQITEPWLWGLAADGSEWRVRGEEQLGWWERTGDGGVWGFGLTPAGVPGDRDCPS